MTANFAARGAAAWALAGALAAQAPSVPPATPPAAPPATPPTAVATAPAALPAFADGRLDAFYVGHSLISDVPDMVAAFAAARAAESGQPAFRFVEQFRLGASLLQQWEELLAEPAARTPQPAPLRAHWFDALPAGGFDALVLVDSVPRGGARMRETLQYADNFVGAARGASPGLRVFVYEPWHCVHSGTPKGCDYDKHPHANLRWRQRIDADAPAWDEVVAGLRRAYPELSIGLIPGGRGLAALHDAIVRGEVPGWTAIERDAFDDDIHLNPYGKYVVACLHYAALFGRSPVGLPIEVASRDGTSYWNVPNWQKKTYAPPSPELATRLQALAWDVAQRHAAPAAATATPQAK
ncbi:MAG: hypothetical protein FJ306_04675 [Planctomycetes bacterium]|nr:hypothetical protein [Planctomycetota bacterium]